MQVKIMMSTYNGENFIKKQIESIMSQRGVDIYLYIRDDGSKDNTVDIIRKMMKLYPKKISLFCGNNIGYRRSFLKLLDLVGEADYYGFADQDDYWKEEKIYRAIHCLEKMDCDVKLYADSLEIVNSKMEYIGENIVSGMPLTLESYYTRSRLAGCTFVFSNKCKQIAEIFSTLAYPPDKMPDHDFVVATCAFACGHVYLDSEKNIYHIRHDNSVTSGGNGITKRIKIEFNNIFKRKNIHLRMAKLMIEKCSDYLNDDAKIFFKDIIQYRTSLKTKMKLICNKKMTSKMLICDIEQRIKIIVGNY